MRNGYYWVKTNGSRDIVKNAQPQQWQVALIENDVVSTITEGVLHFNQPVEVVEFGPKIEPPNDDNHPFQMGGFQTDPLPGLPYRNPIHLRQDSPTGNDPKP